MGEIVTRSQKVTTNAPHRGEKRLSHDSRKKKNDCNTSQNKPGATANVPRLMFGAVKIRHPRPLELKSKATVERMLIRPPLSQPVAFTSRTSDSVPH